VTIGIIFSILFTRNKKNSLFFEILYLILNSAFKHWEEGGLQEISISIVKLSDFDFVYN